MNWAQKHRLGHHLRMYTGWILFFYAATHLLNHSIGIFGLEVMERARLIFIGFWRLPVFEWFVVACLLIHFVFVLVKLFTKTTYKGLSSAEWVQIVLGFMVPLVITVHIFETKIANKVFSTSDTYTYYLYWNPGYAMILFMIAVTVVWTHGCIGMRLYFRQKRWFPKWKGWLSGLAVALPILAIWGAVSADQEVQRLAQDPLWTSELVAKSNPENINLFHWSESWGYTFMTGYLVFIALFYGVRKFVMNLRKRRSGIMIRYLDGNAVKITKGTSLLEASLQANIPHAHVCGGRGRCSTCRVQVVEGLEHLPPAGTDEIELLEKLRIGSSVRLACRTKPLMNCTIHPLLLPNVTLQQSLWKRTQNTGIDKNVAILFTDLRGFTAMAEDKLPYDVVFVLNQYFQSMGHAIEMHHGRIDKFIGDAIMAVFGLSSDPKQACRDALNAARSMRFQLDRLNTQLQSELPEPLQMGFGIHCGHVIIGEMGYKDSHNLVAIGDATNTASRLESLTKDYNCELIVSHDVIEWAGLNFSNYETHVVELRGRQKPVKIYSVKDVKAMEIQGIEEKVK